MLKNEDINIRDPYMLLHDNKYYLYGTRSHTCWTEADGFDCYISENMEDWEGPIEIFKKPDDFYATEKYWAPECVYYQGSFYLFCTFASAEEKTSMYILKSDHAEGPFEIHSEKVTPLGWACIDGTFFQENGIPYLVFSRTFEDVPEGEYWVSELSLDLKRVIGEPQKLFTGKEAEWARPIPFAKDVMGIEHEVFLTDGPCVIKLASGKLGITWSSYGDKGYAVGLAISDSGEIKGPWRHKKEAIYTEDGGHGMAFIDKRGETYFALHSPDEHYKENPCFIKINILEDTIKFY